MRDGVIAAVGARARTHASTPSSTPAARYLLPGFIQTHVHLCQTLFRGFADDMPLLDWLRRRVWPMEAAHTPRRCARRRGSPPRELLLTGTTTVADDGDGARHRRRVRDARRDGPAGHRRQVHDGLGRRGAGAGCRRRTQQSIDESLALRQRWDGAGDGRLRAAFAPRFAVSCSRELLEAVAALSARDQRARPHARVGEPRRSRSRAPAVGRPVESRVPRRHRPGDAAAVHRALRLGHRRRAGAARRARREGPALPRLEPEARAPGIAPVAEMRARGISVSLGADGAACNNRLDMFDEMRLAATLQAVRKAPGALPARDASGWRRAKARGRSGWRRRSARSSRASGPTSSWSTRDRAAPGAGRDPWSTLVYARRGTDVRLTMVDGEVLVAGLPR